MAEDGEGKGEGGKRDRCDFEKDEMKFSYFRMDRKFGLI